MRDVYQVSVTVMTREEDDPGDLERYPGSTARFGRIDQNRLTQYLTSHVQSKEGTQ